MSHPVWVRGLKLENPSKIKIIFASHPVWVRGLKPHSGRTVLPRAVAPRVGAWIETPATHSGRARRPRRTPCGCVD